MRLLVASTVLGRKVKRSIAETLEDSYFVAITTGIATCSLRLTKIAQFIKAK